VTEVLPAPDGAVMMINLFVYSAIKKIGVQNTPNSYFCSPLIYNPLENLTP
jgi:hypothetical protein